MSQVLQDRQNAGALIKSMSLSELKDLKFKLEQETEHNQLLGKKTNPYMLGFVKDLLRRVEPRDRPVGARHIPHIISRKDKLSGRNGMVEVKQISQEEMEELWK